MRLAVVAIALACSARATAEPAAAQAEAMFRQGKELMAAGKLAEACAAFEASQKAEAAISTLLNLANCREKNGEIATAWGLFLDAERQTRTAGDAASRKMHATAADRAASLEKRVPHLTVTVAADRRVNGLLIVRDGVALDAVEWNRPLPIDGGKHTIEARAPGRTPWSQTIEIAAHDDSKTIDVPALAVAPHAETVTTAPPPPPPRRDHGRGAAPWIVAGAALAVGGAAVGLELWARSTYNDATASPDPIRQGSLWQSANTKRYAADGLAVGAVGCAAVSIWLFVRHHDDSGAASASLQPVLAPGHLGLAWTSAW